MKNFIIQKNINKGLSSMGVKGAGKGRSSVFKAGFTLVESLVAISILMIAIASPMLLAQKSLSSATLSKDQMIASFLAQDAIEAVRNARDQIAIRGNDMDWLNNTVLQPCVCKPSNSENCNFDVLSPKPTFCQIDTTLPLDSYSIKSQLFPATKLKSLIDLQNNFVKYHYSINSVSSTESKYSRYINIIKNPANSGNNNEALVNVRVSWDLNGVTQNFNIQDYLYNYSPYF